MTKNICTLLILFSTLINYGQNFTLIKNNNPKAKELKHSLNQTKDSLLLGSDTKILHAEIFNEDFEKIVLIDGFKAQISLEHIPEGKFVVEVKLADKVIIMGLMRYDIHTDEANSEMSDKNHTIAEGKGMMLDESLNVIKTVPNKSIVFILTGSNAKQQTKKNQKFYWVVTKVNNESGSCKTMKLMDEEAVGRLILRHKQELNSVSGKLNELTVWEVYNTTEFMEHQMTNPNFFYSLTSDLFNTTPYYSTHAKVANL